MFFSLWVKLINQKYSVFILIFICEINKSGIIKALYIFFQQF